MSPYLGSFARTARATASPRAVTATLVFLLALASVGPARAHQFWLSPSDYAPRRGEPVRVGAASGVGFRGEARPWSAERSVRFSWNAPRPFPLASSTTEGEAVWAERAFDDSAGVWVQYQSTFASIELPAAEFDAYLEEEGLLGPLDARRKLPAPVPGRERYRRCCKAWLSGHDERRALQPVGQALELVPLSIPGASVDLRVRVLLRGRPLRGALVQSWRQPLAEEGRPRGLADRDSAVVVQALRSDARGEIMVQLREPGEWLLSVVHMEPCADRAAADWESTWASLTFARREGEEKPRAKR